MAGASRLVLVTRPEPGARATARRLEALGWRPLLAPALCIVPVEAALPPAARFQAVLATSANALPALGAHTACPLLAVGDATAARARAAGFGRVASAGGDAVALAALVAASCDRRGLPLLFACGVGEGAKLMGLLAAAGFAVVRHETYAARPVERLPAGALAALGDGAVEAALFFSSATARAFNALLGAALPGSAVAGIEALALSPKVAEALAPLPWRRIRVASEPTEDAILALMA